MQQQRIETKKKTKSLNLLKLNTDFCFNNDKNVKKKKRMSTRASF